MLNQINRHPGAYVTLLTTGIGMFIFAGVSGQISGEPLALGALVLGVACIVMVIARATDYLGQRFDTAFTEAMRVAYDNRTINTGLAAELRTGRIVTAAGDDGARIHPIR